MGSTPTEQNGCTGGCGKDQRTCSRRQIRVAKASGRGRNSEAERGEDRKNASRRRESRVEFNSSEVAMVWAKR